MRAIMLFGREGQRLGSIQLQHPDLPLSARAGGRLRGMSTDDHPLALRATASFKKTLLGGRKRVFRYDACYADGRVDINVSADAVLDGRSLPADAWATRDAAEAACPETGTGPWVEVGTGRLLADQGGD